MIFRKVRKFGESYRGKRHHENRKPSDEKKRTFHPTAATVRNLVVRHRVVVERGDGPSGIQRTARQPLRTGEQLRLRRGLCPDLQLLQRDRTVERPGDRGRHPGTRRAVAQNPGADPQPQHHPHPHRKRPAEHAPPDRLDLPAAAAAHRLRRVGQLGLSARTSRSEWGSVPSVVLANVDFIGPQKYYLDKSAIPLQERTRSPTS